MKVIDPISLLTHTNQHPSIVILYDTNLISKCNKASAGFNQLEPGVAEAEFSRIDTKLVLKKFLTYRKPKALIVPKEKGFGGSPDTIINLPSWLSEEDVAYYATNFDKTGFTGGLNYYRCMNLNWEMSAPWTDEPIKVPVKFMVGDLDLTYHSPGVQDYIHKGGFSKNVPFLQEVVVMEGVGHFINQERPHEVSDHIYEFIKKF
ncbi:alpha/beta-Hydrolases superfamily protein [Rhynchospora pubera]|uniref:Alpha/beta-Hydrolases superfamily protein n=1 Tax=Rhynchospora pubera TaxID=906938 RepID=A0AAV8EN59_9POAL|nr:alpha/beta-Hydrolases superfamily protein [Rhynchospora pubera]